MITVLDLGVGNIGSVLKALKSLNAPINLTNKSKDIDEANKLIIPGVSTFEAGMKGIHRNHLLKSVQTAAMERKIPVLGVCM